jgi:hypothetical protein
MTEKYMGNLKELQPSRQTLFLTLIDVNNLLGSSISTDSYSYKQAEGTDGQVHGILEE